MKVRRVINRTIDHEGDGVNVKGGINAVVAANVGEKGSSTHVSSKQRIVQKVSRKKKDGQKEEG
ncbi:MAG: hypothetical protein ACLGHL_03935 [Actinomycetota bacterium]